MNQKFRAYMLRLLKEDKRMDGRKPLEFRDLKVEYGISKTAEGSAKVTFGNTVVIAGVKVEIGKPYPDTPDQGSIMVNAELTPLSNPEFETGPPSIRAIELARVVDRGIRESKALDFKSLCIESGEKSWTLIIDVVPINADGNLLDAAGLAALAAIKDMKFPEVKEDGSIDYKKKTDNGAKLTKEPIPVTIFKVGEHFIVDPTMEEEDAADARLTIATTEDGSLCAMQKGGECSITEEDLNKMIDIALDNAKKLRGAL